MAHNIVSIIGNLTADPEVKGPEDNPKLHSPLAKFAIGHNVRYKDDKGELQDKGHFFDVTAWGSLAQYAQRSLHKGNLVLIDGRLDSYSVENDQGKKRTRVQIVASKISRIEWPKPVGTEIDASDPKELSF